MSLWWLNPEWKQADCADCGRNIWHEGGDPDMGRCPECFAGREPRSSYPQEPTTPQCDICGRHEAVTSVGPCGVCSEECAHIAEAKAGHYIGHKWHEGCGR